MPGFQTDTINKKKAAVLITGGSGLVGKYLTSALLSEGYRVVHLSRKENQSGIVKVFRWDPEKKYIDPAVFEGVSLIVNLAGANIGERRWTKKRKAEIVNSRVDSIRLLHEAICANDIKINAFISASAIGLYGSVTSEEILTETDPPGCDFLGNTCKLWEEAADLFGNEGIRTVKIRTGICLEKSDAALAKLMLPAKFGFLIPLGNGRQYMPWVHIKDLTGIYLKAIEDQNMYGIYNAVAPQHVTHFEFIKILASVMNDKVIFPHLPAILLRLSLAEMSCIILKGTRISSVKITGSGYKFQYPGLEEALENIILRT
jgi:uncharacterized protein (TIGR01777 family)